MPIISIEVREWKPTAVESSSPSSRASISPINLGVLCTLALHCLLLRTVWIESTAFKGISQIHSNCVQCAANANQTPDLIVFQLPETFGTKDRVETSEISDAIKTAIRRPRVIEEISPPSIITVEINAASNEGSYSNILTSTGTSYVNENFSAFGGRRNASTWSGVPTSGDETAINSVSREGYTGETVLGVTMGLNHLNGRVEDSTIGRFLSPDPEVPEPGNTQSFNRYSYASNNPLTLVDPTGFDEQPPIDPITVTCCTGSPDGGGDSGGEGGGLSPYQYTVLQAGLLGVTNLPNGSNLDMAHAHDGQRGFWLDYNFETYTTTDPEGNEVPAASGADAMDNFSLTVTAPRSNWIPFSDCGVRVDCAGAVGMLGQNAFFRAGQPFINKVGLFVTTVASFGYGSGAGAAAWGSRAFGSGTLFEGLAARGLAGTGRTVIGKLGDLKALGQGERTLLDRLPNLGSPKANWYQNSSVLRQELSLGNPIRDASVDGAGNLINNTGFLQAERNLLLNRGWTYDAGTTLWSPPIVP